MEVMTDQIQEPQIITNNSKTKKNVINKRVRRKKKSETTVTEMPNKGNIC